MFTGFQDTVDFLKGQLHVEYAHVDIAVTVVTGRGK